MGYAVNVAARIQELTKKLDNSFVISEAVYELLDTPPEAEVSSEKMKGVKEAFRLYKIGEHFQYKKEKWKVDSQDESVETNSKKWKF